MVDLAQAEAKQKEQRWEGGFECLENRNGTVVENTRVQGKRMSENSNRPYKGPTLIWTLSRPFIEDRVLMTH